MTGAFWTSFGASLLAGMVTTLGIVTIRRFAHWARHNATYFAAFAAGVLIAASFLHILPKSFSMAPAAPVFAFAGYMMMHVMNRFLTAFVCNRPQTADYALGLVPLLGIGLHSFLDGVVYSIGFSVSLYTGALAASGMVLHEFPEGIVVYTLLLKAGLAPRRSFLLAFAAAAATTPLGTLVSFPFISRIGPQALGAGLALSAGALIYVGATHLLPRTETEPRRFSLLALTAGAVVALGIVLSEP